MYRQERRGSKILNIRGRAPKKYRNRSIIWTVKESGTVFHYFTLIALSLVQNLGLDGNTSMLFRFHYKNIYCGSAFQQLGALTQRDKQFLLEYFFLSYNS